MEIKLPEKQLDSIHFRVLFELAKAEGPDALQKLLQELERFERSCLGHKAIFEGKHPTLSLTSKNKKAIAYLREYKNELKGINLLTPEIKTSVNSLVEKPELLDTYLETARTLESYRVGNISMLPEHLEVLNINSDVYYDSEGRIINVTKHYTDGKIDYFPVSAPQGRYRRQLINCMLNTDTPTTWVLKTQNSDSGWQHRSIFIKDFAFDTSALPTEEELQKYDYAPSLKLYLGK